MAAIRASTAVGADCPFPPVVIGRWTVVLDEKFVRWGTGVFRPAVTRPAPFPDVAAPGALCGG